MLLGHPRALVHDVKAADGVGPLSDHVMLHLPRGGDEAVRNLLAAMEQGIWSACWSIDEESRRRAAAATQKWAASQYGDLDEPRPTRQSSDWRAYRLAQ